MKELILVVAAYMLYQTMQKAQQNGDLTNADGILEAPGIVLASGGGSGGGGGSAKYDTQNDPYQNIYPARVWTHWSVL